MPFVDGCCCCDSKNNTTRRFSGIILIPHQPKTCCFRDKAPEFDEAAGFFFLLAIRGTTISYLICFSISMASKIMVGGTMMSDDVVGSASASASVEERVD